MNEIEQKSVKQKLVYDFFYPGILGSILYDILPIELSVLFFIKILIVVLLATDYYHLYFLMEKKFSKLQKDTWWYVGFDFLVAMSIFVAFKYCDKNLQVLMWSIALIPLWFLIYSLKLFYKSIFYGFYAFVSLATSLILDYNKTKFLNFEAVVLYFIIAIVSVYVLYVIREVKNHATNN